MQVSGLRELRALVVCRGQARLAGLPGGLRGPDALTVGAGRGAAGVHLLLTVEAGEAHGAVAGVAPLGVVRASPAVEARAVGARHGTQLADPAVEAGGAAAGVAVLQVLCVEDTEAPSAAARAPGAARAPWARTHRAAAAVPAGLAGALVRLRLAVGAREPGPAGARVAALPRVGARGPVSAGLVVCAVVQVCRGTREEEAQGQSHGLGPRPRRAAGEGARAPYPGCRKGPPSLPGRCTATAAGRCRADSRGSGCTGRSTGPASPLCTCGATGRGQGVARTPRCRAHASHSQTLSSGSGGPTGS